MNLEAMAGKPGTDRRRAPRRRVLKAGIAAYNGGFVRVPCVVRDLSTAGARLRIDGSFNLPDRFQLLIEIDGLEVVCAVVARKGSELSVRFTAPARTVPPKRVQVVAALGPTVAPSLRRKSKPFESC